MKKNYFFTISAFLLFLSVWGFSDNLFWNVGQPSNRDPKFIFHGLFCLAWMLVFCVQAHLVRTGKMRLHRKLGMAGFLIAIGVTLSTLYVFVAVWKGWGAMAPYVKANRLLLASYSVLVLLAFLHRKRPEWHKRYLLIGTLYMLEPVLSRAFDPVEPWLAGFSDRQLDLFWWIFFVVLWNALFLSLLAYDRCVARRIHPVTAGGFAWFLAIWVFVYLV
jgi:hypothetical protein